MRMQPEDKPLISVLMGAYYHKQSVDLLQRSIVSILKQSYSDFEFLICDDGSTKEAIQLIDKFARNDQRIRLIRPGAKYNLAEKLNVCLAQSKGRLIARMDDDDYSNPYRIEKQTACLREHPEIDFIGSNISIWNGKMFTGKSMFPEYPEVKDFLFRQPFAHPSMMFRKEALLAVDGYSEKPYCVLCEDYDLLLRLYAAGYKGMNQQEILLDYTVLETVHNKRKMRHRWNEAVTRYIRFRELGLLPENLLYVLKPLAVGMLPAPLLGKLKKTFSKI